MFSVLDTAGPLGGTQSRTGIGRACDPCKERKVRCDMTQPCRVCSAKGFVCTYDKARKKRGPTGKRIAGIRRLQSHTQDQRDDSEYLRSPHMSKGSPDSNHTAMQREHLDLQLTTSASSNGTMGSYSVHNPEQLPYWPAGTQAQTGAAHLSSIDPTLTSTLQDLPSSASMLSNGSEVFNLDPMVASPIQSDFIFPSLPVMSSPDAESTFDAFGTMLKQDLPASVKNVDVWPPGINEETLLPWIDVYFKRLHPTIPILNRTIMYHEMLLRKHRVDPQYGAMLLGLCAFSMTQPVQIHERASTPSRSAQARMMMDECVKMRAAADFGEEPSIEMILASFFLFACLFGNNQHKAARLRLREAIDLAHSLGLHLPQSYEGLDEERREQWLRTYLVLSVTERAYALQQRHSIDFRGRPGITARFMQAFDSSAATEYISHLIYRDQFDAVGMTGLLYLMDAFDAIDEGIIDCWNGHCKFLDGVCESFDRRAALRMFHAQRKAREASLSGNISFAPLATPVPLAELMESQQADISITHFWLLNRLWNLCLSHGLLREVSNSRELQYQFACVIAEDLLVNCHRLGLSAMEPHGVGLVEKVHDVAIGVITAINASAALTLNTIVLQPEDADSTFERHRNDHEPSNNRQLLHELNNYVQAFRGGDHKYNTLLGAALDALPGYYR